jgi:membrane protease YdiL (CAAX protease family)
MLPILAFAFTTRYVEEIIARGIIFRIAEERLGTWIAACLLAVLFALLHLSQNGSTLPGALAVGITAGFFMSSAHVMTRKLWTTIGIHSTWYFSQVGIFGHSVSGHQSTGFLNATFTGSNLMTGGLFGAEFSLPSALIGMGLALIFLFIAYKKKNFIKPGWKGKLIL